MIDSFYKSQYNQDKILNDIFFKNKKFGIFLDIGAHDGITLSNTFFYEKYLEWTGLCIEPIPNVFDKLKENRSCDLINGCAYKTNGKILFRQLKGYSEMLSGILESFDKQHIDRIEKELQIYQQSFEDFLSLDVEGSEFEIIKTIDFDKIIIDVLLIENNYNDNTIKDYLNKHNYEFYDRIVIDDVFIRKNVF